MKVKMFKYSLPAMIAAMAFLALGAMAAEDPHAGTNSAYSAFAELNTVTHTSATDLEFVENFDTRTYSEDWSADTKLNTKKIIGTIMLMR